MEKWAFDILGIEVTTDQKAIKKAYAKLVRKYHPEEYPQEWKRIHDAFEAAMQYAQGSSIEADFTYDAGFSGEEEESQRTEGQKTTFEEETFGNDFGGMWGEDRRECEYTREAMQALEKLSVKSTYDEWQRFLEMDALWKGSESVLQNLLEMLWEKKPKRKIMKLILKKMEGQRRYCEENLQFEKARLAEEIAGWCRQKLARQSTVVADICALGLIALAFWVNDFYKKNDETKYYGIEVEEAKEAAAEYLNKKYQLSYTEEELSSEPYFGKKSAGGERVRIGCRVLTTGEDPIEVYLISYKDDKKKTKYLCFDTGQTAEITKALEEEVKQRTGYTEGKLYLDTSFAEEEELSDFDQNMFHTYYEGDLQQFFQAETEAREGMGRDEDDPTVDIRAAFYAPDPQCNSVREKIQGGTVTDKKALETGLEELKKLCRIQCFGAVFPREYYQEFAKKLETTKSGKHCWPVIDWMDAYGSPVPEIFMTACYTGEDKDSMKLKQMQAPVKCMEGVYLIEDGTVIEQAEAPELLELSESEKSRAVSFLLKGEDADKQPGLLALDKEIYQLRESCFYYDVYFTQNQKEVIEIRPHSYTERGSSRTPDGCEGGAYLFLWFPKTAEESEKNVVTIVREWGF